MKNCKVIPYMTLTLLLSSANAETLKGTISKNGQPQPNVKIVIPKINKETITNENGSFKFENLAFGQYEFDIKGANSSLFSTKVQFNDSKGVTIDLSSFDYEEIVVTANPLKHSAFKMTTPATVLSEEELIINRSLSLDQTLNSVTGVNSGSFGAGAGQVIIRGQQGPRVLILNNNIALQDASSVSPDHWISSETLLAKQIEVLKGPATLLYGGGAIGGVVNIVDNNIPREVIDGIEGGLELRASDSALKERAAVVSLEVGLSDLLMTNFSYFNIETSDYEIPNNAKSSIFLESEEGVQDELNLSGILKNTSVKSDGYTIGFSVINQNGFWGLSYSDLNRNYGIPGEEESVRIDLNKAVLNLKAEQEFNSENFFKLLKANYSRTDYQHVELEGTEFGTLFSNDAGEFRLELTHEHIAGFEGVWGFQYSQRVFSAIGEEAYILPSKTLIFSAFLIEERDFDNWHGEFGMRLDNQSIKTDLLGEIDDTVYSVSLGATFNISKQWTLPMNWALAQRLPTAEELFSNQSNASELIPHIATNTIEVGNTELTHETANNIDIGIRYRNEALSFNLSAFYNKIDDFVYLENTGEESEGFPVFNYSQQKATFKGFETDLTYRYNSKSGLIWNYRLFADTTTATLSNGENVPRIPARRIGLDLGGIYGDYAFNIGFVHVSEQGELAEFELPTQSYNNVGLNVNRVFDYGNFSTLVFLKADNLLNEEIREHSSFLKDISPRPGRSVTVGLRLTF